MTFAVLLCSITAIATLCCEQVTHGWGGWMGENAPHQAGAGQGEHIPGADQVDQFQGNVDAQSFKDDATGFLDSLFGDTTGAKAAYAKANQIESAPVATGGGGGYSFTPAQIEDQLKQCDDLVAGLRKVAIPNARLMAACTSPAEDTVASKPQAQAVAALGNRAEQRVENQIKFVENWSNQLKAVRQNYLDQEGNTVDTWKKLSGNEFTA